MKHKAFAITAVWFSVPLAGWAAGGDVGVVVTGFFASLFATIIIIIAGPDS